MHIVAMYLSVENVLVAICMLSSIEFCQATVLEK